jgi:hypothetical protein
MNPSPGELSNCNSYACTRSDVSDRDGNASEAGEVACERIGLRLRWLVSFRPTHGSPPAFQHRNAPSKRASDAEPVVHATRCTTVSALRQPDGFDL